MVARDYTCWDEERPKGVYVQLNPFLIGRFSITHPSLLVLVELKDTTKSIPAGLTLTDAEQHPPKDLKQPHSWLLECSLMDGG